MTRVNYGDLQSLQSIQGSQSMSRLVQAQISIYTPGGVVQMRMRDLAERLQGQRVFSSKLGRVHPVPTLVVAGYTTV